MSAPRLPSEEPSLLGQMPSEQARQGLRSQPEAVWGALLQPGPPSCGLDLDSDATRL